MRGFSFDVQAVVSVHPVHHRGGYDPKPFLLAKLHHRAGVAEEASENLERGVRHVHVGGVEPEAVDSRSRAAVCQYQISRVPLGELGEAEQAPVRRLLGLTRGDAALFTRWVDRHRGEHRHRLFTSRVHLIRGE